MRKTDLTTTIQFANTDLEKVEAVEHSGIAPFKAFRALERILVETRPDLFEKARELYDGPTTDLPAVYALLKGALAEKPKRGRKAASED